MSYMIFLLLYTEVSWGLLVLISTEHHNDHWLKYLDYPLLFKQQLYIVIIYVIAKLSLNVNLF